MNAIPSINSIRAALERVEGAIKSEPDPEYTAKGSDPGTAIQHFDPERTSPVSGWEEQNLARSEGILDYEANDVADHPAVIFEIPPSLADGDIADALGDGPGELLRLVQLKGLDALGWYVTFHQRAAQYGVHVPIEGVFASRCTGGRLMRIAVSRVTGTSKRRSPMLICSVDSVTQIKL